MQITEAGLFSLYLMMLQFLISANLTHALFALGLCICHTKMFQVINSFDLKHVRVTNVQTNKESARGQVHA